LRNLIGNLRYALRMLRKKPGFTLAVVTTLMLGIGATTAIYTIVYSVLIAPLPYPNANQLVVVWSKVSGHRNGVSAGDFLDWQRQSSSFQQLAAWNGASFNVATQDQPQQLRGQRSTPGWFAMQGIPFMFGRDFLPEEGVPGKDHVIVLTHKLWNELGADPNIIGHTMQVDGKPHTVVGVLSPGFADRLTFELAAPLAFTPEQINHEYHWVLVMGRLKTGVTLQQAQADMDAVTLHVAATYPKSNTGWGARVDLLKNDFLPPERINNLWFLLGAVGFVLLITCANVVNLLLASGAGRQREIAIRTSMGASRVQIFLQFLTESLLLAVLGGALGIAFGKLLIRAVLALAPEGILPSEASFQLDPPVLFAALAVTTLAGLLFGCAPAWYASRVEPQESLKDGGRSTSGAKSNKLRRLLIVGEFSLALSLLAGAGLAIHSFWNLTRVDLGVQTDHVLTFQLNQPQSRFGSAAEMSTYNEQILAAVRAVPGVSSVATVTGLPLLGPSDGMDFSIVGGPSYSDRSKRPGTGFQSVSPDYFKTFGIDVVEGRAFTSQDTSTSTRVAMVNQEFVRRYLKGLDPLQQRIAMEDLIPGSPQVGPIVEWQIVGVFHNVRSDTFRQDDPEMDVPFAQSLQRSVNIGVRTARDPGAMARSIAAAVHSVDPQVAVAHVRNMDQVKSESLAEDRFTMLLFAAFALVALLLAAVGIYALMAFAVSQRTQEIGLRLALGSGKGRVISLILRDASLLAVTGLVAGLGGAVIIGRIMRSTLYEVGAMDEWVLMLVTVVLFVTALLAAYLPARRAAAIDPMQALRTE
jgi:putative ABC transport system permease protein